MGKKPQKRVRVKQIEVQEDESKSFKINALEFVEIFTNVGVLNACRVPLLNLLLLKLADGQDDISAAEMKKLKYRSVGSAIN